MARNLSEQLRENQAAEDARVRNEWQAANPEQQIYGTPYTNWNFRDMPSWQQGMTAGLSTGRSLFYDDPDMISSRERLTDLQKGYDGKTLGALRESSRQQVAGQRAGYMNNLRSNMAKGGVGGARGAAMQGAADQRFAQTGQENERNMRVENAKLIQTGTGNLNDFLMKQKYGQLATGTGFGQMASAQYTADRGVETANSGDKGLCFITTAVCEVLKLPDNNYILNTFRKFRDEFMGGKKGVKEYYEIAPKIVAEINKMPEARIVYMDILRNDLLPALICIETGELEIAEKIYSNMVLQLKEMYLQKAA